MTNEELLSKVAAEAEMLKQQYSESALLALLQAEETRIQRERTITLGKPAKDLAKEAMLYVGDKLLVDYRTITKSLLWTYAASKILEYLITSGLVAQQNASREQFVASLIVALIIDNVCEAWEKYRQAG